MIETKLIESQIARLKKEMTEHRILAQRYEVEMRRKERELGKLQTPTDDSIATQCVT